MPIMLRRFWWLLFLCCAVPGWLAALTARAELVEGKDWRPFVPAQPVADPQRIEVLEFFSYGCPHCAALNPKLVAWAKTLPADVVVERVPVTFGRAAWEQLARLYFALHVSGELERLDQAVFDAAARPGIKLYTESDILAWVAEQGIDRERFRTILSSFEVDAALGRARLLAERYRIDAVPRIIVDGRYVVVGSGATDYGQLLTIAEGLIEQARARRAAESAAAAGSGS